MQGKDIFCRFIRGDMNNPFVQQATQWMMRIQHENHFDPDVMSYPTTMLMQAYEKGSNRPLLYMPVHQVFMMEALGPNPQASDVEIALALAQMTKTLAWDALVKNVAEMHFPCSDQSVIDFALRHHYTRMTYAVSEPAPQPAATEGNTDKPAEGQPQPAVNIVARDMPHLKFKTLR